MMTYNSVSGSDCGSGVDFTAALLAWMNLSMIFGKNNTIIYNRDMNKWNNEILKQENNLIN